MQPRQMRDTSRPVRPSFTYFTGLLPVARSDLAEVELQEVDGASAVDRDDLPRHEARRWAAEVQDHVGDVGAVADHADGIAGPRRGPGHALGEAAHAFGVGDGTGRDRVP